MIPEPPKDRLGHRVYSPQRLADVHPSTFLITLFFLTIIAVAIGIVLGLYLAAVIVFHTFSPPTL